MVVLALTRLALLALLSTPCLAAPVLPTLCMDPKISWPLKLNCFPRNPMLESFTLSPSVILPTSSEVFRRDKNAINPAKVNQPANEVYRRTVEDSTTNPFPTVPEEEEIEPPTQVGAKVLVTLQPKPTLYRRSPGGVLPGASRVQPGGKAVVLENTYGVYKPRDVDNSAGVGVHKDAGRKDCVGRSHCPETADEKERKESVYRRESVEGGEDSG
ncbi:hypothetical protein GQ44DRAFT_754965 [Phaeosphaeriaceae sp. PMI808]|nr:hypothetical protein GQ44DRAFT_754965 [Phaeosphaeriaceae sp. PMI808]